MTGIKQSLKLIFMIPPVIVGNITRHDKAIYCRKLNQVSIDLSVVYIYPEGMKSQQTGTNWN